MAKKTDEWVHYITQRVVTYLDAPQETRIPKEQRSVREDWRSRWFGMLPFAISMWVGKHKEHDNPTVENQLELKHRSG
jgi:hypothetical protein